MEHFMESAELGGDSREARVKNVSDFVTKSFRRTKEYQNEFY